eukprot:SAG11_NODE_1039_length_6074_cov_11.968870_2_plen_118_part_00
MKERWEVPPQTLRAVLHLGADVAVVIVVAGTQAEVVERRRKDVLKGGLEAGGGGIRVVRNALAVEIVAHSQDERRVPLRAYLCHGPCGPSLCRRGERWLRASAPAAEIQQVKVTIRE